MGNQMQLKVLFGMKSHGQTFRKKKVVSFSALFFLCTLTWITEKEPERVIENSEEEKHGNSKRR